MPLLWDCCSRFYHTMAMWGYNRLFFSWTSSIASPRTFPVFASNASRDRFVSSFLFECCGTAAISAQSRGAGDPSGDFKHVCKIFVKPKPPEQQHVANSRFHRTRWEQWHWHGEAPKFSQGHFVCSCQLLPNTTVLLLNIYVPFHFHNVNWVSIFHSMWTN